MASDSTLMETDEVTETTPLILSHKRRIKAAASTNTESQQDNLPYSDYHTIDWLQDLVQDSHRRDNSSLYSRRGIRYRITKLWDASQGWVAAFLIGLLTASIAAFVDVGVEVVADLKDGYCTNNIFLSRRACCASETNCRDWKSWTESYLYAYAIYVGLALAFGIIAGSVTMTTKSSLTAVAPEKEQSSASMEYQAQSAAGKVMYMAAGSGIPEIKTVLSGFSIPHLFDLKVLIVKAIGSIFAVATGMCLGKEGPFVHISACVGYLVTICIPKYADNQRKLREMLSMACSAGLSVAFGAPIGGVLFSYEEISTYFPRRVLWRSCLCSVVAAAVLKELNPTGTGKLVLFETNYGVNYDALHYFVFVILGVCGGIFGGVFCQANFLWSKSFRKISLIKNNPVFELALVTLITAVLQFPNMLIRETGDIVMQRLLVDCNHVDEDWICQQEAQATGKGTYYAWLVSGTFVKLFLTTITFGCKVPSGIIIPAMDAGALFGRMIGQLIPNISPGIFAMVGSAAFLAGVSRMTVSLAVIMFELTGEVNFIPPFMIAILTAKWVADAISADGVYDLAQHLQGHPFLEAEGAISKVREFRDNEGTATVGALLPSKDAMDNAIVSVGPDYRVLTSELQHKLSHLQHRGLSDSGLVFINDSGVCHGYISQYKLEQALQRIEKTDGVEESSDINVLEGTLAEVIDRSPLTLSSKAPLEYAVELFGKLGISYLVVTEEDTAKVLGVVSTKQLIAFLDRLK
ncbi:H(+)/Cl(-) exchange transporter 3 [Fusarium oxysporum f. sp. rapae]|uniref:H(+)/Cl(-) exchange transporter 3 n=1 Tax=Fusarium oxysporum f. sp. rapae TaxID=485398 RepID=A0A8J5NKF2_FUSOX|nr:H(+)/Cl(-) exchange transporter 3 [Fusarium oxysporum f. sp. rapae]